MAHDNPALTGVNIPFYDSNESCVQVENLKLDPEKNNTWLVDKQEGGATILATVLHFNPRFDAWELFVVFLDPWDEQKPG